MSNDEKRSALYETESETESEDLETPSDFICCLTMEIMDDPLLSKYGHNYERAAILEWLTLGHETCPMTRQSMKLSDLISNHYLRTRIHEWKIEHQRDVSRFLEEVPATIEPHCFGIMDVNREHSRRGRSLHQLPRIRPRRPGQESSRRRRSSAQTIESRQLTESSTSNGSSAQVFLKQLFARRAVSSQMSQGL